MQLTLQITSKPNHIHWNRGLNLPSRPQKNKWLIYAILLKPQKSRANVGTKKAVIAAVSSRVGLSNLSQLYLCLTFFTPHDPALPFFIFISSYLSWFIFISSYLLHWHDFSEVLLLSLASSRKIIRARSYETRQTTQRLAIITQELGLLIKDVKVAKAPLSLSYGLIMQPPQTRATVGICTHLHLSIRAQSTLPVKREKQWSRLHRYIRWRQYRALGQCRILLQFLGPWRNNSAC